MKKRFISALGIFLIAACQAPYKSFPTALFENGKGDYNCYRIPAIIKAPDGGLLAFAEGRRKGCSDFGDVDLLMRRSKDGGKSWDAVKLLVDNDTLQAGNPAPVVDFFDPEFPKGRVLLFYNTGNASEYDVRNGKGTREVRYISSEDNGLTWSEPTEITSSVHFNRNTAQAEKDWRTNATTPGHALQFKRGEYKGRIYVPANHSAGPPQDKFNEYRAYGFYSDDHGKTWSVSPDIAIPSSNEAIGVELPNGDLMLNIREQNGNTKQRLVALSSDGGTTWNKTYFDAELITPVCQSSLLLFETDKRNYLIYSGPNSSTKREKMTLKVSLDFEATWTHKIEVHNEESAYSDLVQIDDRNLGLFYEQDFKKIVFQVFTLEDLLLE